MTYFHPHLLPSPESPPIQSTLRRLFLTCLLMIPIDPVPPLVIHVCLSVEAATADIPVLLSGHALSSESENIGSKNYASPPAAVVLGGGFDVVSSLPNCLIYLPCKPARMFLVT